MAYKILQAVIKDGETMFSTDDVVKIKTTLSEEITGRINSIRPNGTDYIINMDCSAQYNAKYREVNLSAIAEATVIE